MTDCFTSIFTRNGTNLQDCSPPIDIDFFVTFKTLGDKFVDALFKIKNLGKSESSEYGFIEYLFLGEVTESKNGNEYSLYSLDIQLIDLAQPFKKTQYGQYMLEMAGLK